MMSKFSTQLDSYLSKEQIKALAPVVFATEPTNKNVSEKYLHVNTETVIDDLANLSSSLGLCPLRTARVTSSSNCMTSVIICATSGL